MGVLTDPQVVDRILRHLTEGGLPTSVDVRDPAAARPGEGRSELRQDGSVVGRRRSRPPPPVPVPPSRHHGGVRSGIPAEVAARERPSREGR